MSKSNSKLTMATLNKIHEFLSKPGNCVPTYTDPVDGKVYYTYPDDPEITPQEAKAFLDMQSEEIREQILKEL